MKYNTLFNRLFERVKKLLDLHKNIKDIRLEQVEYNKKEDVWEVVVSYSVVHQSSEEYALITSEKVFTCYQFVEIDKKYELKKISMK